MDLSRTGNPVPKNGKTRDFRDAAAARVVGWSRSTFGPSTGITLAIVDRERSDVGRDPLEEFKCEGFNPSHLFSRTARTIAFSASRSCVACGRTSERCRLHDHERGHLHLCGWLIQRW